MGGAPDRHQGEQHDHHSRGKLTVGGQVLLSPPRPRVPLGACRGSYLGFVRKL